MARTPAGGRAIQRTMPIRIVQADAAPKAIGPYSQGVLLEGEARAGGRSLWCSGQIPLDPATGELVQGDITVQTERVLANVAALLQAAGMAFGNVVKTTVFLVDLADFGKMNECYAKRFTGNFPARSTVQVAALPRGARVEIEIFAVAE
jgi:2-iminobutanoate/2-iminopropanoate deaminase